MRNLLTILISALTIYNLTGQSLMASYAIIYTHTNAIVPVKNGKDDYEGGANNTFAFSYEHFFKQKKISITSSYIKYDGCTLVYFERGGVIAGGGELLAKGFCGVVMRRIDLGVSYLLTKKNKRFYFKPFVGAGLQRSKKTGVEYWGEGLPINGPSYFELEPMSAETMNTTQIVPSLGFRTGFVFWKRLDIGLGVQGVYAFKAYQKMYLKYQYNGEIQPMAEYESTGTGLFVTLGVGYRFAKLIK